MNNNIIDNSENLTNVIKTAREKKKYSQRKLARICDVSHTEIIKIESGERKKPDVDILGKVAGALDLGLMQLLRLAGYENFVGLISIANNKGRFKDLSIYDLKDKILEYEKSELDLLDDSFKKRDNVLKQIQKTNVLIRDLKLEKEINKDELIKFLNEIVGDLKMSSIKYDYSKLPSKIDNSDFTKATKKQNKKSDISD